MKRKNCLSNKLLFSVLCFLIFTPPIFADVARGRTEVTEEDASPSVFPYQIKFANGTVTDNSDGTASVSSSGASTAASYVTTQAEGGLSAEFNLGSLTTGLLKHSVAAGVSTPATAVAGTDYMNTTLASANIYVGNATNVTTAVAMSGDVAIDNTGATTIQVNSVALGTDTTNNYVATIADSGASEVTVSGSGSETAAVTLAIGSTITRDIEWDTWAEHPSLLSGQILVGNATNITANVTMSGDGTMSNAGALAVNDDSHAHTSTTLPATVSYLGTAIDETEMAFSDITTLNANTSQHGFLKKLSNTSTEFMNGQGNWATPAAGAHQSAKAEATGSQTTTSATYADMAGATVTITTGANPVLILFTCSVKNDTLDKNMYIIIDIDGTDVGEYRTHSSVVSRLFSLSTIWLQTMSAASHTFKIQWKNDGGTTTLSDNASLIVIELK